MQETPIPVQLSNAPPAIPLTRDELLMKKIMTLGDVMELTIPDSSNSGEPRHTSVFSADGMEVLTKKMIDLIKQL